MNFASQVFVDKSSRMAAIELNGKQVGVLIDSIISSNGFDTKDVFTVQLANIHNQSNPIRFEAKTLKGLIGKINRHKFQLVKFSLF